jgi:multiple sugar transport system permease protein/raffinose/stachyose/melibiose transport system permease protein
LLILAWSSAAGFAFAKLKFRRQGVVFIAIIGCLMVPVQSIIIPEYVNLANVHLVNNYLGAILVYAALGTPFATFLMTVFFRGLPDELIEAGLCDGVSYPGAFLRIAVPMAMPALATVAVLQFIQIWDDLLIGLLFLQEPTNRTITVGLAVLSSGNVVSVPALMAGSVVSALPAVVVYLFFQRYLVRGLTMGAVR